MSTAVAVAGTEGVAGGRSGGGGKKKLILLAVPLVLALVGAGLWFSGILPGLLGAKHGAQSASQSASGAPVFVELPEMVANLNVGGRRASFIKLVARVELSKPADLAAFTAAEPRVLDLFQTYLREMRPEELRGSEGTYRLREELIARASLAAAPARVVDVLFTEMLVQ
ncbi:MAG: flagellar basal body-associated FliL family protein [Acetobacteraceae bacterium]